MQGQTIVGLELVSLLIKKDRSRWFRFVESWNVKMMLI